MKHTLEGAAKNAKVLALAHHMAADPHPLLYTAPMAVAASNRWTVSASDAGNRLDLFLAARLNLSRQSVRRLLESNRVYMDGRVMVVADKGRLLSAMADIEVLDAQTEELVPQPDVPLAILSQGPGWVIVDKQPGQAVHPLRPGERGTLLNALAARFSDMACVGEGGLRGGVVHRLDVETSGAVLFATRGETWAAFRQAFQRHETEKIYRALVRGHPPQSGRERKHLHVAQHRPARVRVIPPGRHPIPSGARLCDLSWQVLEQYPRTALVEVRLGTGFLHQIRVMFAELGYPVLGDGVYGTSESVPRQMLHAWRLRVIEAEGISPLPQDFCRAMELCRQER